MKQKGDTAELKFMLLFHELGYVVSKPFGDNSKYDFIVDDLKGRILRVQVKSTSHFDKERLNGFYRINAANGHNKKTLYTSDQIDYFALYVVPEDAWYFVPIDKLSSMVIKLYPHRETDNKYEKYRLK